MKFRFALFIVFLTAVSSVQALDIPMNSRLADEPLDSKTCYGIITSQGKLVGYEMGDLYLSIGGKLVVLPSSPDNFESKYQKLRTFAKNGVSVSILQKSKRKKNPEPDYEQVSERSEFFISEHGRYQSVKVKIISDCTP